MTKNKIQYKYKEQKKIEIDTTSTFTEEGQFLPTISPIGFETSETRTSKNLLDKISILVNKYCTDNFIDDIFVNSISYLGTFNCFRNVNDITNYDLTQYNNLFRSYILNKKKFLILLDLTYYEKTSDPFFVINNLSKLIADQGIVLIATSGYAFELIDNSLTEALQKNLLNVKAEFHLRGGSKQDYFAESFEKTYSTNYYPEIDDYSDNLSLVFFSTENSNEKFIFQGMPEKFDETVVERFLKNSSDLDFEHGKYVEKQQYLGPISWKIKNEISTISKQFKTWKKFKFKDFIIFKKITKKSNDTQIESNKIYFKSIKNKITNENKISILNHINVLINKDENNFYEFEIDQNVINSDFFNAFLNTNYGLSLIKSKSLKGNFTLDEFYELYIYAPEIIKQKEILLALNNRNKIVKKLQELKKEILINPSTFNYAKEKVEGILRVYDEIDEYTRITSIISNGESDNLEFKQSFTLDTKDPNGGKNEKVELSALKTIAAFLNTRGGTLLLGIHDKGEILGVEKEIKLFGNDTDKYKLFIKDKIKNRLGAQVADYIQWDVKVIGDIKIVEFTCAQSKEPVWIDKKDFYIRMSPATELLEGQAIYQYTNSHFTKISSN